MIWRRSGFLEAATKRQEKAIAAYNERVPAPLGIHAGIHIQSPDEFISEADKLLYETRHSIRALPEKINLYQEGNNHVT